MRVELPAEAGSNVIIVQANGTLTKQDYEELVPVVERLIAKRGKLRVLLDMNDFHGWTAGALWEDIKFDAAHFNDIDRVALVGDAKWEAWMAVVCRPFTTARVRFFDRSQRAEARRWITEGM